MRSGFTSRRGTTTSVAASALLLAPCGGKVCPSSGRRSFLLLLSSGNNLLFPTTPPLRPTFLSTSTSSFFSRRMASACSSSSPSSCNSSCEKQASAREAYQKLAQYLKESSHLEGINGLVSWDTAVLLPKHASDIRGKQSAALAGVLHERHTSNELKDLLCAIEEHPNKEDELNEWERAVLREARRSFDKAVRVPKELAKQEAELESRGYTQWVKAREQKDFSLFAPVLKEWIELRKKLCKHVDPEKPPYDVCIDRFEPGMTTARYEVIFEEVKAGLIGLLQQILQKQKESPDEFIFDHSFVVNPGYDVATQTELGKSVALDLGFDTDRGRMDVSVHPFTGGTHPTDVRITTRYSDNLIEGIMGTIHEVGHALYEQGRNKEYEDLPVTEAQSMGIHESQSLFYERMVGQHRNFWKHYWPKVQQMFGDKVTGLKDRSVEDFYRALNLVTPSLIRVDADEVTYSLHIVLRFEIERGLLDGSISVDELPEIWNKKMQQYLGVKPPHDSLGVLQDVHWSSGLFGYFPSYSLGAMYACQFFSRVKEDIPDLEERIERGEFAEVKRWLNTHIHCKGKLYSSSDELCKAVTGQPLAPKFFLDHLQQKYADLYRF